jgi:hypothetical protein
VAGCCERGNEPSGCINHRVTGHLVVSQERINSMELACSHCASPLSVSCLSSYALSDFLSSTFSHTKGGPMLLGVCF